MKRLIVLMSISIFFISGCSNNDESKANELYVKATLNVEKAINVDASYKEKWLSYKAALESIDLILTKYSSSEMAVRLISGDILISNVPLGDISKRSRYFKMLYELETDAVLLAEQLVLSLKDPGDRMSAHRLIINTLIRTNLKERAKAMLKKISSNLSGMYGSQQPSEDFIKYLVYSMCETGLIEEMDSLEMFSNKLFDLKKECLINSYIISGDYRKAIELIEDFYSENIGYIKYFFYEEMIRDSLNRGQIKISLDLLSVLSESDYPDVFAKMDIVEYCIKISNITCFDVMVSKIESEYHHDKAYSQLIDFYLVNRDFTKARELTKKIRSAELIVIKYLDISRSLIDAELNDLSIKHVEEAKSLFSTLDFEDKLSALRHFDIIDRNISDSFLLHVEAEFINSTVDYLLSKDTILYWLVRHHSSVGNINESTRLVRLIEQRSKFEASIGNLARAHLRAGNNVMAIELIEQHIKIPIEVDGVFRDIAEYYISIGKNDIALSYISKINNQKRRVRMLIELILNQNHIDNIGSALNSKILQHLIDKNLILMEL